MRFTPDMAVAFGDWLERDQIHRELVTARPELSGTLVLDTQRPLLQIPRESGGMVIVARMADPEPTPWIVGIAGGSAPVLHELSSLDAVVALALELLDPSAPKPDGAKPTVRG